MKKYLCYGRLCQSGESLKLNFTAKIDREWVCFQNTFKIHEKLHFSLETPQYGI